MIKINLNIQYGRSLLLKCVGYTQYFLSDVYTNSTRTKKAQVETAQCGRSMIEMLGVLAIVGVLSVGGIAGYSKAMEKFKINKTIDQITHIATNIRTLYAQQSSYSNLDAQKAIKMGIIPDSLTTSDSSWPYVTNAFNGSLDITSFGEHFVVALSGLSSRACLEIVTSDWGSPSSSGFLALTVSSANYFSATAHFSPETCSGGAYNIVAACPGNSANPSPMSVARAADACNYFDGTNNMHISINFIFK